MVEYLQYSVVYWLFNSIHFFSFFITLLDHSIQPNLWRRAGN